MNFGLGRLVLAEADINMPGVVAPELLDPDLEVDHRADIYALGLILYRMLAGRRAFSGATALEAESRNLSLKRIPYLTDPQWRALFLEFPDRFMGGTDTFSPERWYYVVDHAKWTRSWLDDLPSELAQKIAYLNAEALLAARGR